MAGALLLSALLVNAPTLVLGHVFVNIDLLTHYRWSYQFAGALAEGTLYPRWLPLANFGLGEPSFVIIHPGYYYLIAGLTACGLSIWDAMRTAAVASSLFLGVVAYWLLRGSASVGWAWIGAVGLQASPFFLFLFGYYGALPWHFSLSLALLAIGLSVRDDDARVSVPLALIIMALCMTHLLVAFMVLLCVGLMKIGNLYWGSVDRGAIHLLGWSGSALLGIGAAAIYVLLAVTSGPLFNPEHRVDEVYLNWRNSFIWPVITSRIFGVRWAVVQWILPLMPLVAFSVTGWALYRGRGKRDGVWKMASRFTAVGVIGLVMASELAYPLYANIPFLTNVQLPYRFLTVATLASAVALALAGVMAFRAGGSRGLRALVVGGFGLSLALCGAFQWKLVREGVDPHLGVATLAGNVAVPGAEPANIGAKWRSYVDFGGLDGYCRSHGLACSVVRQEAHRHLWEVTAASASPVIFPLFGFPAWTVYLDGVRVAGGIDQDTGLIAVEVPAGSHEIEVRWTGLWQEHIGLAISGGAVVLMIAIAIRRRRRTAFAAR